MRKVTKDEFYNAIGPLNVVGTITNAKWPYSTDFTLNRELVGRIVGKLEGPFEAKDYYLIEARA